MTASVATTPGDYGPAYFANYAEHGDYSWTDPEWQAFFTNVASRLVAVTAARTALDVGCAKGLLVQAFRNEGVDAWGIDISPTAIAQSEPGVRDYLQVGSAEKLAGSWDLITCVEVLEHVDTATMDQLIDAMCGASNRVLLSSTPGNFDEPTHVNVRQPADWAASFAERGFFRRLDVDVSFVSPWAVLFECAALTPRDVVHRYEGVLYPLRREIADKRAALLDMRRQVDELVDIDHPVPSHLEQRIDELERVIHDLRHRLLTSRDHAIGAESEIARQKARAQALEAEVARLEAERGLAAATVRRLKAELKSERMRGTERHVALRDTETWRTGTFIVRPIKRIAQALRLYKER